MDSDGLIIHCPKCDRRNRVDLTVLLRPRCGACREELLPEDFVAIADNLVRDGQLERAENLLRLGIAFKPDDWRAFVIDPNEELGGERVSATFWDEEEFMAASDSSQFAGEKSPPRLL